MFGRSREKKPKERKREEMKSAKPLILLFFTNKKLLNEISTRLRQKGFTVIVVSDEFDVYTKSVSERPDLILMTTILPDHGTDTLALLRGQQCLNPVILYGPAVAMLVVKIVEQIGGVTIVDEASGLEPLFEKIAERLKTETITA